MASSTKYRGNGVAVAGKVADRRKSAKGMNGASFLGAGIAIALVVCGGMGAISALRAPSGFTNGADAGLQIALADDGSVDTDTGNRRTMGRHAATFDRDAFNERMTNAVLAMEDPAIAVIPEDLSLASLDKNGRVERESALTDEKNVALLREALKSSGKMRAARLALAQGLSKQQVEYRREVAMLEASQSSDDDLPSTNTALAYAAAPSAREALEGANDPFSDVLSGQNEAEAGVLLPDDDIPLPSFRPAPPAVAKVAPTEPQKVQPKTAYAKPDKPEKNTLFSWFGGGKKDLPGAGSKIAIYDITNQVVIMPNGQRLEAHSGRGQHKDSPKYVNVHSRGSTPPNVYTLRMRESLFHGVEAIRMTPVGTAKMYGRNGFLTHSYLRRIPGDSAGCIAFADYKKFLNAFKRGEVTKIVVVPDMSKLSTYMAML